MNSRGNPAGTFCIKTLGCKVNQYETEMMRECLGRSGFAEASGDAQADYCVINSCTVTQNADAETRNLARHFHKINPSGKIVIAGCYAELEEDRELLSGIPGVTHLARNREKPHIAEILLSLRATERSEAISKHGIASPASGGPAMTSSLEAITNFRHRDRAFIKIQDGCGHRCSYCKVALVRGRPRSKKPELVLEEARGLLARGFREIVLTGVCLGAWGRDIGREKTLERIAGEIAHLEGDFRIRLSSIEPVYVTEGLLELIKNNPKICKHLHVPLQSGDNGVLRLMKRTYTARKFSQLIKRARNYSPDIAFTTDILVGFPGEGVRQFNNTRALIRKLRPSRLHVFSYSPRRGTPAERFKGAAGPGLKKERVKTLISLGRILAEQFAKSFIEKKEIVLVESRRTPSGLLTGYTDRYVRVLLEGDDSLRGRLVPVKIKNFDNSTNSLFAVPSPASTRGLTSAFC